MQIHFIFAPESRKRLFIGLYRVQIFAPGIDGDKHGDQFGGQCGGMWSRGNVGECWRLLLKSEQNPLTRSINEIYGTHPTREALSRICGYDIGAPVNSNDRGITKGYIVTRSRMTHKGRELLQGKHSTRGAGRAQRETSRASEHTVVNHDGNKQSGEKAARPAQ